MTIQESIDHLQNLENKNDEISIVNYYYDCCNDKYNIESIIYFNKINLVEVMCGDNGAKK